MTPRRGYPTYREHSRVTFDRLPSHWDVVRGRHLVTIRTGSGDTVDADPEGKFPFYVRSDQPLCSERWEFDTTAVLTAGDGAGVAKVFHLVSGKFMAHQRVYVLDNFKHVTPEFFFYAFKSMFHLLALDGSAKSTVDSVRRPMIADMPFGVPPVGEQRAIVDFLDRETTKIDALVFEQEGLVRVLRERRSAVITHACDVDAAIVPLRRAMAQIRQGSSPNCEPWPTDGVTEWAVLKVGCSNTGRFRPDENKRLPDGEEPGRRFVVRRGEIVMSRSNTKELVGSASVVAGDYSRLMLSDLTYGITVRSGVLPEYVAYALSTARGRWAISSMSKGTSPSMQKISQSDVSNIPIAIPTFQEQRQIVDYLDGQTEKIDALIAESVGFIGLAHERRAALITAAVTGRIDVRGEVA